METLFASMTIFPPSPIPAVLASSAAFFRERDSVVIWMSPALPSGISPSEKRATLVSIKVRPQFHPWIQYQQ